MRLRISLFLITAGLIINGTLATAQNVNLTELYQTDESHPQPYFSTINSSGTLYFTVKGGAIIRASADGEYEIFVSEDEIKATGLIESEFITIDDSNNLYIGGALESNSQSEGLWFGFFRVAPNGSVDEIVRIQSESSGLGLKSISSGAADRNGNLYITGYSSDNVIKINSVGEITEFLRGPILPGNVPFESPRSIHIDSNGNIYVAATGSDNVIKVSPEGEISEVINGDYSFNGRSFAAPFSVTSNQFGELVVSSIHTDGGTYFISSDGQIKKVLTESGDGTGFVLSLGGGFTHGPASFLGEAFISPRYTAVDSEGNFYVAGSATDNIFRINRNGNVTPIIGTTRNSTPLIDGPYQMVIDQDNVIYVTSTTSDNIVKIENSLSMIYSPSRCTEAASITSITDTFNCFSEYASLPVFRFYNSRDNAFFYTSTFDEAGIIKHNSSDEVPSENRWPYEYQGATFGVALTYPGSVPLYRFYNYKTGHHFFTASEAEREFVLGKIGNEGWSFNYEGVAFRVYLHDPTPDSQGVEVPVFRFYSPSLNRHFYTANPLEANLLTTSSVWNYEGVGFYGEQL